MPVGFPTPMPFVWGDRTAAISRIFRTAEWLLGSGIVGFMVVLHLDAWRKVRLQIG